MDRINALASLLDASATRGPRSNRRVGGGRLDSGRDEERFARGLSVAMTTIDSVRRGTSMKRLWLVMVFVFSLSLLASGFALAADDSKVKAGTNQIESGAKKFPDGKIGEGVDETARGIGHTVVEGAKYSGEKLKEAGKAAEPPAKSAWGNARDGAVGVGHSVKGFFTNLFSR
jgi:hypothetical protein